VNRTADGLGAQWRWLQIDPLADRVANAWRQRVVNAASIGFLSHERHKNSFGGFDHTKTELAEISLVPVGANPEAIRERVLKSLQLWPDEPAGTAASDDAQVVLELCDDIVIELADPLPDPAARHHQFHAGELIEVDPGELRRAMAGVLAGVVADTRCSLGDVVAREVSNAMNRARGRVD
jgi:hypothetical protein